MKQIVNFRLSEKGLVIDLADQVAATSVNARTGDILLDEGFGEDRVSGAAILLSDNPVLKLKSPGDAEVQIEYGSEKRFQHLSGVATSAQLAAEIVSHANSLIQKCRVGRLSKANVCQADGIGQAKDKKIVALREIDRGFFVDLDDQPSAISVNRKTRDVLLDEGEGNDRCHGAVILGTDNPRFVALHTPEGFMVSLRFGEDRDCHFVGCSNDHSTVRWVCRVNQALGGAATYKDLSTIEERILQVIKEGEGMSVTEISAKLGISGNDVYKRMERMLLSYANDFQAGQELDIDPVVAASS